MKKIFFSILLAGALALPGAGMAAAAPQHGAHGGGGFHGGGAVHGGTFHGGFHGGGTVHGGTFHGGGFRGEHFEHNHGGVIAPFYGGWYDPYWYGWGRPYYYGPYGVAPYTGGIRLDVKPSDGEVYVDSNYVGRVSEFNGAFQSLDLTPGGHQIEIRTPGYQPLSFTTYIQPDHTTHYKARLVPAA